MINEQALELDDDEHAEYMAGLREHIRTTEAADRKEWEIGLDEWHESQNRK